MRLHLAALWSQNEAVQTTGASLLGSGVETGHRKAAAARSKATTGCIAAAVDFLHKDVQSS
jgi:hypothetical protein